MDDVCHRTNHDFFSRADGFSLSARPHGPGPDDAGRVVHAVLARLDDALQQLSRDAR
jgi:hypothetical protein